MSSHTQALNSHQRQTRIFRAILFQQLKASRNFQMEIFHFLLMATGQLTTWYIMNTKFSPDAQSILLQIVWESTKG